MERVRDTSTVKILLALYKEGELYTEQLARKAGLSLRHTKRVLPVMVEEGIIEQYQQKNKNYYKLTDKGMALAWGLSNPDALADLYAREETVRRIGIEALRNFFDKTKALTTKEMSLFRAYFLGEVSDEECRRKFNEIRQEENYLRVDFEKTFSNISRGLPSVALAGVKTFEDLLFVQSLSEFQEFKRIKSRILVLKQEIENLKHAISGLEELHRRKVIQTRVYQRKKNFYRKRLRYVENLLEELKSSLSV